MSLCLNKAFSCHVECVASEKSTRQNTELSGFFLLMFLLLLMFMSGLFSLVLVLMLQLSCFVANMLLFCLHVYTMNITVVIFMSFVTMLLCRCA